MHWAIFAMMTVLTWGLYGAFLHKGTLGFGMADPNARMKAFLFVGVAYFIVAIVGPLILIAISGKGFDFSKTEGDALDLRDLLQGEVHLGQNPGNLGNYLHFEISNGHTVVHISTTGAFSAGYDATKEDQTIVLQNVNLTVDANNVTLLNDNAIIQDLLNNKRLIVD